MSCDLARARVRRGASGHAARRPLLERCLAMLLAVCAVVVSTSPATALAHARLTRAVPGDGAVLATPPTTIELWFNELLDEEFNSVAVYRAGRDGAPADEVDLATAPPRVDAADRTHLTAGVGPLSRGSYVVQWKVLSRDGHSARGRVRFTVEAAD